MICLFGSKIVTKGAVDKSKPRNSSPKDLKILDVSFGLDIMKFNFFSRNFCEDLINSYLASNDSAVPVKNRIIAGLDFNVTVPTAYLSSTTSVF